MAENYILQADGTLILKDSTMSPEKLEGLDKRSVRKINFPNDFSGIKSETFKDFVNLEEVDLPKSLTEFGECAFLGCTSLKRVKIDCPNLKNIPFGAFMGCESLNSVEFVSADGVIELGESCFEGCKSLSSFACPKNVLMIMARAFFGCESLQKIKLNDNLLFIESEALTNTNIHSIFLPNGLRKYHNSHFDSIKHTSIGIYTLADVYNGVTELRAYENVHFFTENDGLKRLETNNTNAMFLDRKGNCYIYDLSGDFRVINDEIIKSKATKWNNLDKLIGNYDSYPALIEWLKLDKTIPHYSLVDNLFLSEIPLFYCNNNEKNWREISKIANIQNDVNRISLFGLAHALGVFSRDGKESSIATNFIKEHILGVYNETQIHEMFDFNSKNKKYNHEFAQFFMLYFPENPDFMVKDGVNLMYRAHDNFNKILRDFPNKKIITRQDNERLTPKMVRDYLLSVNYQNVTEKTEKLASLLANYGYSQDDFDAISKWYLKGISIPDDELTLKCAPDTEKTKVSYELLSKNDPLGAVLGDITNCCQTYGNSAQECVEYGMTRANSGFLVIKKGERILGQAWVWYDEKRKQVTLDNIEVPSRVLKIINSDKVLQDEIVECLKRVCVGFDKAMNDETHYRVKKITVGAGYNDFNKILQDNFDKVDNPKYLEDYNGYTDADEQFLLKNIFERTKNLTRSARISS